MKNYFILIAIVFIIMCIVSAIGFYNNIEWLEIVGNVIGVLWICMCIMPLFRFKK